MFAFGFALMLFAAPLPQQSPDDLPAGVVVHSGDEVPEPVPNKPEKPEPPEVLPQQLPFKQFAAYEPELNALLDADPLLARKISLWETHVPMRRILAQVSDKQTVLRVTGNAAELRLQVALKKRPVSVLMRSLARMLPGIWTREPDGKTYTLHQTAAAEKYQRDWWNIWQQEFERGLKERQTHLLNYLRADTSKVGDYNTVVNTNDPRGFISERKLRDALRLLPPEMQERLAAQNSDYMIYSGQYGGEKIEGAVVVPWKQLPGECRDAFDKQFGKWRVQNATDENALAIRLQNLGGTLTVALEASQTGASTHEDIWVRTRFENPALSPNHGRLKNEIKWRGNATPALWRTLDKFAAAYVWKTPEVKREPRNWMIYSVNEEMMPEILNELHEKGGAEFIAECPSVPYKFHYPKGTITYSIGKIPTRPTGKMPTDIAQVLPIVAAWRDKAWRKSEEGIYLVRANRWYRDDAAIVPDAKIQEWQKVLTAQKVKPGVVVAPASTEEVRQMLDLDSEIVTTLSAWQVAKGLQRVSVPLPPDPDEPDAPRRWTHPFGQMSLRLLRSRHTLQWYAGLNTQQRDALLLGRLPVSALNSSQQSQLAYLLPDIVLADPNRPLFVGVQAIAAPTGGFGFFNDRPLEGGLDNRTGIELFLSEL